MGYPKEGETIQIQSYKHNGLIHRIWNETTILKATELCIIGANDRTMVTESDRPYLDDERTGYLLFPCKTMV